MLIFACNGHGQVVRCDDVWLAFLYIGIYFIFERIEAQPNNDELFAVLGKLPAAGSARSGHDLRLRRQINNLPA